ncbi:hypothetical protein AN1V17_31670 [Vallitalea sediminicola]
MITAYLVGISTYQENEDIEVRYCIYDENELVCKESVWREYKKPLVVTHWALLTLLKKLKEFGDSDITIKINDGALYEQINGTSTTKNKDVLVAAKKVRERLKHYPRVTIKNVGIDNDELNEWNKILEA